MQQKGFLLIFYLLFFAIVGSFGQDLPTQKLLNKIEKQLLKDNYKRAINIIIDNVQYSSYKHLLYAKLGDIYMSQRNYEAAEANYILANQQSHSDRRLFSLSLCEAYIKQGKISKAASEFDLVQYNDGWLSSKKLYYFKIKKLIENPEILSYPIEAHNLSQYVNSKYDEYFPSISPNDSTLIYTRRFNDVEEDFYISLRDTCEDIWIHSENMGYPPNSSSNEGAQSMSYDRHYLVFMRCGIVSQNGWAGGGCDLFFSHAIYGGWLAPIPFGATINTPAYEGMPSLGSDNKTLYFVSDREGGYGGLDIWKTEYLENEWQKPVNLGPKINTQLDDFAPFIASDGHTLYFSSNGHPGIGGSDLFLSRLSDTGWSKPINLGHPYNSPENDFSAVLTVDGQKIYFASNRNGSYGKSDLYWSELVPDLQPKKMDFFYGYITDLSHGDTITSAIIDIYSIDNEFLFSIKSNRGDGSYFFTLPANSYYRIRARRWDYPEMEFIITTEDPQQHPPKSLLLELERWK